MGNGRKVVFDPLKAAAESSKSPSFSSKDHVNSSLVKEGAEKLNTGLNDSSSESRALGEGDPALGLSSDGSARHPFTNIETVTEEARKPFDKMPQRRKTKTKQKARQVGGFADNRDISEGMKLRYIEPTGDVVHITEDDLCDVEKTWGYCLVGKFPYQHPGKKQLFKLCHSWKVHCEYFPVRDGWMLFKFQSEHDRETVMKGGPYSVHGIPLLLKVLPKFFTYGDDEIDNVPV